MWPREYPLASIEMSFLLPHFLKEGRGKLAVYFTRVYNPVWTNPDGMTWIEMLSDESKVERARVPHADLERDRAGSPTTCCRWVTPRNATTCMSQETHAARWIGFRQPVLRGRARKAGQGSCNSLTRRIARPVSARCGRKTNSGSSFRGESIPTAHSAYASTSNRRIDAGEKLTVEEYYRWIFENSVPGLAGGGGRRG